MSKLRKNFCQFFLKTGATLPLLFCSFQSSALVSSYLNGFKTSSCAKNLCLKAEGSRAAVSKIGVLIAAEKVTLNVTSNSKETNFLCDSFTQDVLQNYFSCEFQDAKGKKMVVAIDLDNSYVSYYQ